MLPSTWHDLAANHDFELDVAMRRNLIDNDIYFFPVATKQGSISFAHTAADIQITVELIASALVHCEECVTIGEGS